MPAILTPALALRHLRELSTDIRAAAALDEAGVLLAGDAAAEAPSRELLAALLGLAGPAGRELVVRVEEGTAHVMRAADGGPVLVVGAGPHALLDLLRHDLATLLHDLRDGPDDAQPEIVGRAVPALAMLPPRDAQVVVIDAAERVQVPESADSAVQTAIFAAAELVGAHGAGNPSR